MCRANQPDNRACQDGAQVCSIEPAVIFPHDVLEQLIDCANRFIIFGEELREQSGY
jgi:hypothetical protein